MQIHKSLKGLEVKQLPVNRFKERHQRKIAFFHSLEPDPQITHHLLILLAPFYNSFFQYSFLTSVFPILILVFFIPIIIFPPSPGSSPFFLSLSFLIISIPLHHPFILFALTFLPEILQWLPCSVLPPCRGTQQLIELLHPAVSSPLSN